MINYLFMVVFAILTGLGVATESYGWASYNALMCIYYGTKTIVEDVKGND